MIKRYAHRNGDIYTGIMFTGDNAAEVRQHIGLNVSEVNWHEAGMYEPAITFRCPRGVHYAVKKGDTVLKSPKGEHITAVHPAVLEMLATELPDDLPGEAPKLPAEKRKEAGGSTSSKTMRKGIGRGTCALCGRPLIDARSVARGMGPVCYEKANGGEQQKLNI